VPYGSVVCCRESFVELAASFVSDFVRCHSAVRVDELHDDAVAAVREEEELVPDTQGHLGRLEPQRAGRKLGCDRLGVGKE
jgi:hypothetical protein